MEPLGAQEEERAAKEALEKAGRGWQAAAGEKFSGSVKFVRSLLVQRLIFKQLTKVIDTQ